VVLKITLYIPEWEVDLRFQVLEPTIANKLNAQKSFIVRITTETQRTKCLLLENGIYRLRQTKQRTFVFVNIF
jgi:hypothetical protein